MVKTIESIISELVSSEIILKKKEFVIKVISECYPHIGKPFTDLFVTHLMNDEFNDKLFIINHQILHTLKIFTTYDTIAISKKLQKYQLIESKDYIRQDNVQPSRCGGVVKCTQFLLTKDAFLKIIFIDKSKYSLYFVMLGDIAEMEYKRYLSKLQSEEYKNIEDVDSKLEYTNSMICKLKNKAMQINVLVRYVANDIKELKRFINSECTQSEYDATYKKLTQRVDQFNRLRIENKKVEDDITNIKSEISTLRISNQSTSTNLKKISSAYSQL